MLRRVWDALARVFDHDARLINAFFRSGKPRTATSRLSRFKAFATACTRRGIDFLRPTSRDACRVLFDMVDAGTSVKTAVSACSAAALLLEPIINRRLTDDRSFVMLKKRLVLTHGRPARQRAELNLPDLMQRLDLRLHAPVRRRMTLGEALFDLSVFSIARASDLACIDAHQSAFICRDRSTIPFDQVDQHQLGMPHSVVGMRLVFFDAKNARPHQSLSTPVAAAHSRKRSCCVRWVWWYCSRRAALLQPPARQGPQPLFVHQESFNTGNIEGFYSAQRLSKLLRQAVHALDSSLPADLTIADIRSASISSVLSEHPDQVHAVQRLARWRSRSVMRRHYDHATSLRTAQLLAHHFQGARGAATSAAASRRTRNRPP